jgi:hypothetical protein
MSAVPHEVFQAPSDPRPSWAYMTWPSLPFQKAKAEAHAPEATGPPARILLEHPACHDSGITTLRKDGMAKSWRVQNLDAALCEGCGKQFSPAVENPVGALLVGL